MNVYLLRMEPGIDVQYRHTTVTEITSSGVGKWILGTHSQDRYNTLEPKLGGCHGQHYHQHVQTGSVLSSVLMGSRAKI